MKSFYELDSWQEGRILVRKIYDATRRFPREELFGLSSQMRRAAISVPANIAEGFGRPHPREKIQFYNHANGSIVELQSHLYIAHDLTFIDSDALDQLLKQTEKAQSILQGLIRSTKRRLA